MIALPAEVLRHVFAFLDIDTVARVQRVCRRWCEVVVSDKALWQEYGRIDDPLPQAFDRKRAEAFLRRNDNRFRSFHVWINDDNPCTLEDFEWILQRLPQWNVQSLGLVFGMTATRVTHARHRPDGYSFQLDIDEEWWAMDSDSMHLSPSCLEELQEQLLEAIDACTNLTSLRFEASYLYLEDVPGFLHSRASTLVRRRPYMDLVIDLPDMSNSITTAARSSLLTRCKLMTIRFDALDRAVVWEILNQSKASIERLNGPVVWAHAKDGSLAATDWQETLRMPNLVQFISEPPSVLQYVRRESSDVVPPRQIVQIPLLDCPRLRHATFNCFVPRTLIASLMTSSIETLTFALDPGLRQAAEGDCVLETCFFTIGYFIEHLKNCSSLSSLRLIAKSHAIESSSGKLNVQGILEELTRLPSIPIASLTIWGSRYLSLEALSSVVRTRTKDSAIQPITYLDVQDCEFKIDGSDGLANEGEGMDEQVTLDNNLDDEAGQSKFAYWSDARFKSYCDLCESVPNIFINSDTDEKQAVRGERLRRRTRSGRT